MDNMPRLFLLILLAAARAIGHDWTWSDAKGKAHDRAALDEILQEHQIWLKSDKTRGRRADLHKAMLPGVDLSSTDLSEANLSGVDLSNSKLFAAILDNADLTKAILTSAVLVSAKLRGALLSHADLSNALLGNADLAGSRLVGTLLAGTDLSGANLSGAVYEPKEGPDAVSLINARGLDRITWDSNPKAFFALRKTLFDAGFARTARQLTAAIQRRDQSWLERMLFDWTSEWGANALRPLELIGAISISFALVYWIGMHTRRGALFLITAGRPGTTSKQRERVFRLSARTVLASPRRSLRKFISRELRMLGTASLFSLRSSFNLGFREFNIGLWFRMMQPRDFDLGARGWMRTLGGVQSLVCLALLALSLLSYFGRPFE
jgi:hypothetical protein